MKTRLFPPARMILLAAGLVVVLGGCGPGKYVPKPNEEIYGTWTNKAFVQEKVVIGPAGWQTYASVEDTSAMYGGTEIIAQKRTDSDGSLWYKTYSTVTLGPANMLGMKTQNLYRLTKGATVLEAQEIVVREFGPKEFPARLDPKDQDNYRIYYRSTN